LKEDFLNFSNLKLQIMAYEDPLPVTPELSDYVLSPPTKDNLGVDNVYMINLERRPDRRTKMDTCLNELGIKYQWVKAVDGKKVFYHS
jgi:collagen beta-1,O-galactosyltransferase